MSLTAAERTIFADLFAAVAEEMGNALMRLSFSPNIKERRDFSCAVFDAQGRMVAQAAHIPVHLGSMPLAVRVALSAFREFAAGDVVILNDPFAGGTHLPDVTVIVPVFWRRRLWGFVASRAHYADIGGAKAGSLFAATSIFEEGVRIPPIKLWQGGKLNAAAMALLRANVRLPDQLQRDLEAQRVVGELGARRVNELLARYGARRFNEAVTDLLAYAERMMRSVIAQIPDGVYAFTDMLDDDGVSDEPVPICVRLTIAGERAVADFTGTAPQRVGSINCPLTVTLAAVRYCFLCLAPEGMPLNEGAFAPIEVVAPAGTVVNAVFPAAVAAGNVETSQRIVDVVMGALAQALPDRIPAASCGTMNNFAFGGYDPLRQRLFAYYETIGGGAGACPHKDGADAVHVHMTNTQNTPIEALEMELPVRVTRYELAMDKAGKGKHRGGAGIVREVQFLVPAQVSIISERRKYAPYGLQGGENGGLGENWLVRQDGTTQPLPGKVSLTVQAGERIRIVTPGGGGWGKPVSEKATG
ncbi:Acetophenone carboxylase delta subunit [bacterium HR17]|uniref:Acetophenone carboxylase delta subunit n=1 Tax=Candidatus Fervidibacter japonicus TaxID=2035412 RepID=A0A2H5XAZ0_9BACT|nr:Acetophenone carboxylase delta subunit [bacterium HR17]